MHALAEDEKIQRLLPQDQDAERALLACFMLSPKEVGGMCAERHLSESAFIHPSHAIIFRHLSEMWTRGEPIDLVTLTADIRGAGELALAGGPPLIGDIYTSIPFASNATQYAVILEEMAGLRKLIATCTRFAEQAYAPQDNIPAFINAAQQSLAEVSIRGKIERKPFKTLLLETIASIEDGDDATADILTGISAMDDVVRMRRGNFIVIGGEAKSGKTTLAGTILAHAAVKQEKRVAIVSLEMSATELIKKAISSEGRVNVSMIGRQPSEWEIAGVIRGATALTGVDIEIVDDTNEWPEILAVMRQLHAKKPLDLIVLDYIQLAESSTGRRSETRQEIVAQISRSCKRMAGEFGCVVIGLSQLNDEGKLRESRAIGQDANAVIQVEKTEDGGRSIRVVAQRNGASNVQIPVRWLPQFSRFENAT